MTVARGVVADVNAVRDRAGCAMAAVWPQSEIVDLQALQGGTSSLTYLGRMAHGPVERVVVKMAPPGLEPVRNRDVMRQARLLIALDCVPGLRVPTVFATDVGAPTQIPPLFVMEYVEGQSYEPLHDDPSVAPAMQEIESRTRSAILMLTALQSIRPARAGLGEEPVTSLAGELAKWQKALATCQLDEEAIRPEQLTRQRLLETMPGPLDPVVLHGDWRLGNMQCAAGEVRAVIDWEIWSVGDPRLDLAWMMLMVDPAHPTARPDGPATPGPDQVLAWYQDAVDAPVPEINWVQGLIRYKQAAASALLVKNAIKRGEAGDSIDRMRFGIPGLLAAALEFIS